MKRIALLIIFFTIGFSQAQTTLKAPVLKLKITNAQDNQWAILYRMLGLRKQYVENKTIVNDTASFYLPKLNNKGVYLITYGLPEHENQVKVFYDGKGDVEVSFDRKDVENSLTFVSDENNLYYLYKENNKGLQSQLLKAVKEKRSKTFAKLKLKAKKFQEQYEGFAGTSLVKYFIEADKIAIPTKLLSLKAFKAYQKAHYFDAIDFNNPYLYQADYLLDKVKNYTYKDTVKRPNAVIKKDFDTVMKKISNDSTFQYIFLRDAWKHYAGKSDYVRKDVKQKENAELANYIGDKYLKPLTKKYEDIVLEYQITAYKNLSIGNKAPNIVYKNGKKWTSLYELKDADKYLIIFWSSTCSHCLAELPKLYKEIQKKEDLQVLAIGIEDADMLENWRIQKANFKDWQHVFGKGKWQNSNAKKYAILATPTYFILDKDKKIIAKPDTEKEVLDFLK